MKLLIPLSFFYGYPRNQLWIVDTDNHEKIKVYDELIPDSNVVEGKGITGIEWINKSSLVCCDFNRVFTISPYSWSVTSLLFKEDFNDLHHLSVYKDAIYISNTGLDAIELLDHNLLYLERYNFLTKGQLIERFHYINEVGDYYSCPKKTPQFYLRKRVRDIYHINHTSHINGKLIATSFKSKCIIDVKSMKPISKKLPCHPHDGKISNGFLWVTTIDGFIYRADISKKNLEFEEVINLFTIAPYHGWCRGLHIIDNMLFVAITAISEKNKYTQWLRQPKEKTKTGVYSIEVGTRKIVDWYDLSHINGSRIFSIIDGEFSS